jgi:hypothetical protein
MDGVEASDLPVSLLRELCEILLEGAQRAARLALEGRSTGRRGPLPARIAELGDVRIAAYKPGSLELVVNAPTFSDASGVAAQLDAFSEILPAETTALDLLFQAAKDAVNRRQDSERLDAGMLDVLARTHVLFGRGVTSLQFKGREGTLSIGESEALAIKKLREQTPEPRVARIQGVLDTVTVSNKTFILRLGRDGTLRGIASSDVADQLGSLLGKSVVVEGTLYFKASSQPLRIEADHISVAQAGDELWARVPRGEVASRPSTVPTADIGELYGKWPGEETDEEIFAALAELS